MNTIWLYIEENGKRKASQKYHKTSKVKTKTKQALNTEKTQKICLQNYAAITLENLKKVCAVYEVKMLSKQFVRVLRDMNILLSNLSFFICIYPKTSDCFQRISLEKTHKKGKNVLIKPYLRLFF